MLSGSQLCKPLVHFRTNQIGKYRACGGALRQAPLQATNRSQETRRRFTRTQCSEDLYDLRFSNRIKEILDIDIKERIAPMMDERIILDRTATHKTKCMI